MISRDLIAAASSAGLVQALAPMSTASEKLLRQSSGMNRQASVAAPSRVGPRICAYLRSVHPHFTAKSVAADTGLPLGTVEKLLERESTPHFDTWSRLVLTYRMGILLAVYGYATMVDVFSDAPIEITEDVRVTQISRARKARDELDAKLRRLGA